MFTGIESLLVWFENLPNAEKYPLILSIPAILFVPCTCYQLGKEKWLLTKRNQAIHRGIDRIFEGHSSRSIRRIVEQWMRTSNSEFGFRNGEVMSSMRDAFNSGYLMISEESAKSFEDWNISKEELKKWLINCNISIPSSW